MLERAPRGVGGKARGRLAFARDVAAADAGALDDPLVGGVDASWPAPRWSRSASAARCRRRARPNASAHCAASLAKAWARKLSRSSAIFRMMSLRTMPHGDADRVGDALGLGAAMALHHQAVEAEEDRAIMVVGVEVDLEQVERRPRQREAGLGAKRALEGAAQQVGDEPRRALRGLERDVAGEAVGNDHVDGAARQLVALGEAVEAERQVVALRAAAPRLP